MQKRAALASSLFLSTVAGFIIVVYSIQTGIFGGSSTPEPEPVVNADPGTLVTPMPPPPPQVIEEYIYEDIVVPNTRSSQQSDATQQTTPQDPTGTNTTVQPAPTAPPAPEATATAVPAPEPAWRQGDVEDLKGVVIAISAQGFTLDSEDGTAAVTVTAETAFVPRGSGDFGFSSIQMGMYLKTKVWMGEDHTPTGEDGSFVAVVVEESED